MSRATAESARRPDLLDRVREAVGAVGIREKRMFGGTTFMLREHMLCCVSARGLMVRVGVATEREALAQPHARPCMGAGRRMAGFIMVSPAGLSGSARLKRWLAMAVRYVETLPHRHDRA